MKGYKGFEKGLVCRGKQYAENTVFEEDTAKICKSGMHFCELPHQVFEYYSPSENHEFAEVEALDEAHTDDNKKYCTKKMRIGTKISVFDICKISVSEAFKKFGFWGKVNDIDTTNAGDYGAANAGDRGAASVGKKGVAIAFGRGAKAKGRIGSVLVLIDTDDNDNIIAERTLIVDGEKIKEDTYYTIKNNRLTKAE